MGVKMDQEMPKFNSCYHSEEDCIEALVAMKWPNGFVCPLCAYNRCTRLNSRRIPLFECRRCAHQTSPLVDTIFEGTHLPLLKWFQALELFLLPDGISAMRLSQVIRVTYKTAWLMLHKIRYTLGEFDARELLSGDVRVNSDHYGVDPFRHQRLPHSYATAIVAGCTITESGEPEQVKIHLVSQKRGDGVEANRHEIAAFINRHVDAHSSVFQTFPLAFRLYLPLRKIVRKAWESLKSTYVALGIKYLQAYLNECTVRRRLHQFQSGDMQQMLLKLLHMCMEIPSISYHELIARKKHPRLTAVA
ncbi:transposase [uncultured Paenibacillus sp.]|uniref:transposase n=1 Tax=uncultured Paenibacillus sp. TaxID=227322 RepID=UPI0015AEA5E6|nr:transposase [uncultured Paenibacillus sp.]